MTPEESQAMISRFNEMLEMLGSELEKQKVEIQMPFGLKLQASDLFEMVTGNFAEGIENMNGDATQLKTFLEIAYNGISYVLGYTDNPRGE